MELFSYNSMCLQKSKIIFEDMKKKETSKNIFSITLFFYLSRSLYSLMLFAIYFNFNCISFYDIIVKEMAE